MLPITAKAEGCVIVYLYWATNYPWMNSCPNFCICHLKTTNPGVAWLRDLKKRKFWCKHINLKISKLLWPFTSVEDVSTKYSFQTYEHFNIAFLRGQIWRPDQIFHPIYFHLDLKHTHLDPVCNIRSEYTFNERIYLHIPEDYLTFWMNLNTNSFRWYVFALLFPILIW